MPKQTIIKGEREFIVEGELPECLTDPDFKPKGACFFDAALDTIIADVYSQMNRRAGGETAIDIDCSCGPIHVTVYEAPLDLGNLAEKPAKASAEALAPRKASGVLLVPPVFTKS